MYIKERESIYSIKNNIPKPGKNLQRKPEIEIWFSSFQHAEKAENHKL